MSTPSAEVTQGNDPIPLAHWLRQHERTLGDRLGLLRAIGDIVDRAHRDLVVFGHLSSASILVAPDGTPILRGEVAGGLALPAHLAAPEQLHGAPLRPASDQYALGLILHELLTGLLPSVRVEGQTTRLTAAVTGEPAPLASHSISAARPWPIRAGEVRGDLDAIVARALERDPRDRYASVAEMMADVQRRLEGAPVLAAEGQRGLGAARPLARRQRRLWLAVLMLVALLLAALAGAWMALRDANDRAERAVTTRDRADAVNATLVGLLTMPRDMTRGADLRVTELLDDSARLLASDSTMTPDARRAVHALLARAYASLGRDDAALMQVDLGLASTGRDDPARLPLLQVRAQVEALRCQSAAAERAIQQLRTEAESGGAVVAAAEAAVAAARLADCRDDFPSQQREAEAALALTRAHVDAFDTRAAAVELLARAQFGQGDLAAAARTLQETLAEWPAGQTALAARQTGLRHLLLQLTAAQGDLPTAERLARENLQAYLQRHGEAPHPSTITARSALASILYDRGELAASLVENDRALADAVAWHGADAEASLLVAANRANVLKGLGRYDEAESEYRRVIAALARLSNAPGIGETRLIHSFNLLELLNERGRFRDAKSFGDGVLAEAERVLGREHIVTLEARDALGVTALGLGNAAESEALHRAAFAAKQKVLGDDSPYTATAQFRRGLALIALDRKDEARVELEAALTTRRQIFGPEHPDTKAAER
ncbi:MAG TPA: tetratricopeptide repeat protein, partial [Patescibacteria group bacterium]|nr:tetratricopeptide repeat protein [Patescibacteria group bacterium]